MRALETVGRLFSCALQYEQWIFSKSYVRCEKYLKHCYFD